MTVGIVFLNVLNTTHHHPPKNITHFVSMDLSIQGPSAAGITLLVKQCLHPFCLTLPFPFKFPVWKIPNDRLAWLVCPMFDKYFL